MYLFSVGVPQLFVLSLPLFEPLFFLLCSLHIGFDEINGI